MQVKKNPKFRLENYSKIFMQLGLVLALFVVYVALEQKTYDKSIAADLGDVSMVDMEQMDIPITKVKEPEVPKQKPVIPDEPEVVEDDEDIIETIVSTTEVDETTEIIDVDTIREEDDPDPIVEDVDFMIIEDVPVFPGCEGNNDELKACFNKKMQKHFIKKFDADLPNELGLPSGKKRMIMLFKIDATGEIIDIRVKAPHPKLEKEAERIINLLPKMKPGKQRGRPVGVKYTLPVRIDVE
jgi:protein TonB